MPGSRRENRSVVDFDTEEDLRNALLSSDLQQPHEEKLPATDAEKGDNNENEETDSLDWVLPSMDPETTEAQSMTEELHRLQVLKSYLILDAEKEETFERLTGLAARVFNVPIALVSLVDLGRQWFMSNRGLGDTRETPRRHAFCAHAILNKHNILIVSDASKDFRFKDNPLVKGPPKIRFYAGAPLISPEGYKLGTFCIIDSVARPAGLSQEEQESLRDFAHMTIKELVDRRQKLHATVNPTQLIAFTAHDLMTPLTGVQLSLSLLKDDEEVQKKLKEHHMELLTTAANCGDLMIRICQTSIDTLRHDNSAPLQVTTSSRTGTNPVTKLLDLINNLCMIMEPIPKTVPISITLGDKAPTTILSDDLTLFRSSLNLISNALERTDFGSVHLRIFVKGESSLMFECTDTGADISVERYSQLFQAVHTEDGNIQNLGLSSVATLINSLDGEYGFRPRSVNTDGELINPDEQGSIFWFSVPILLPSKCGVSESARISNVSMLHKSSNSLIGAPKQPIIPVLHKSTSRLLLMRSDSAKSFGQRSASGASISSMGKNRINLKVAAEDRNDLRNSCFNSAFNFELYDEIASVRPALERNEVFKKSVGKSIPLSLPSRRKRRALVVDDSLVLRKSVAMALKKLGFEVTQAVNGKEGLEALQNSLFDLTLLDFLMPVMDGLDCIKQYRDWEAKHRPGFRQYICGISAHATNNDGDQGVKAGMDGFQSKPITIKILTEMQDNPTLIERSKAIDVSHGVALTNQAHSTANLVEPPIAISIVTEHQVLSNMEDEKVQSDVLKNKLKRPVDIDASISNSVPPRKKVSSEPFSHAEHFGMEESSMPSCLIATGSPVPSFSDVIAQLEQNGWKVIVVYDGPAALHFLKLRNWDAFLVDDITPQMSGAACISEFRQWEEQQRINKQRNVFLVSNDNIPPPRAKNSWVIPPTGADGVLPRPVDWLDLECLLKRTKKGTSYEIVVRQ